MTIANETKPPFVQTQSHTYYNLAILISAVLALVFVPLFMLKPEQTKQFINNGRETQVILDVLLLIVPFFIVVAGWYWTSALLKRQQMGAHLVMFIFSWIVLSGFLFPLTNADGLLDLRHETTHVRNMVFVVILSVTLSAFFVSRFIKITHVFMGVFLAVTILPSLPRAFSQFEKRDDRPIAVSLSPDKNLIMVGFDGLPGHVVKDVLSAELQFAETFKDFNFYENVTATSPATDASLMGIVYGNYDFTKQENRAWPDNDKLFFNQADKVNFTTSFKYNLYNENGTKLSAGQFGQAEQRNELFDLYHNVSTRLFGVFGARLVYWIDEVFFTDRKGKFYTTVEGFDRLSETLTVDSEKPAVFYTHFTFTHWPTVIDENCENRDFQHEWLAAHENIQGVREGVICGMKKYTEFIGQLKDLGVYENSMIVLLSDHGKPVHYYDKPPHNLKINGGEELGFDRYQPFLMIKPAGQSAEAMTLVDRNVLLDDLAQTNCFQFQTKEVCDLRPGINLLDAADTPPDNFYIHVVKDETSSWVLPHHKAVSLPRNMPLAEAMADSLEIELSERR